MQHFLDNDSDYCTSAEAGKYLNVSKDLFEELASAESDWCRPLYFNTKKQWRRIDVFALRVMHEARQMYGTDPRRLHDGKK